MFRRYSINFTLLSIVLDMGSIALALLLASSLRPYMSFAAFAGDRRPSMDIPVALFFIFPLIWVVILLLHSVYDGRRNLRVTDELTSLTLGSILAGVSLAGTLYLSYREVSRLTFATFFVFGYSVLVFWRLGIRLVFRWRNGTSQALRHVLVIGAGPVGRQVQEKISRNWYMGLRVVGLLDDDPKKRLSNQDILGKLEMARDIIRDHRVDDVVIALPARAHRRINWLVAELHDMPVKVWVIPDYFDLALHKAVAAEFAGIPMLDLRAPALNDYQRMVKRAFDILVSLFILPLASLLMGIIAVAIRLDDPGPILFRQKRVGENSRLFEMFKFRTMVKNAEEMRHLVESVNGDGELIHKHPDDPRVTRVGRFLRHTSLDELPQLFNVLKGDMSLVGPRPEVPDLVEDYQPWQHKRFAVPQGITGWWQVNGRSDKPMHLHTEEDLYYVQNYSLWLDLQILLKTIWVVLRGKGAY